jgi:hypothetical protein
MKEIKLIHKQKNEETHDFYPYHNFSAGSKEGTVITVK